MEKGRFWAGAVSNQEKTRLNRTMFLNSHIYIYVLYQHNTAQVSIESKSSEVQDEIILLSQRANTFDLISIKMEIFVSFFVSEQ